MLLTYFTLARRHKQNGELPRLHSTSVYFRFFVNFSFKWYTLVKILREQLKHVDGLVDKQEISIFNIGYSRKSASKWSDRYLCPPLSFFLYSIWTFFKFLIKLLKNHSFKSLCHLLTFFLNNFPKKLFQKHYQSAKRFGPKSAQTFCQSWSGSSLIAKVISKRQK